MKKSLIKTVYVSIVLFFGGASAGYAQISSVAMLNQNIEQCFEQTRLGEQGSKRACRDVIRSKIANRYNKAVAFHNRGVISLNQGEKQAALRDFNRAMRLYPNLKQSESAATRLTQTAP